MSVELVLTAQSERYGYNYRYHENVLRQKNNGENQLLIIINMKQ